MEQIEHGHHIFRAYLKHAFVKQYEKFSTFLRNEICSNNLSDFGLKKGLEHLADVREKFLAITDRFATFQAQSPERARRLPALAAPGATRSPVGTAKFPGIKIHDTRMIRLMEVLLHGGTTVGGWTRQANPRRPPDGLRTLRRALRPESTPLRPAQDEGPWAARTRRQTIRLPPHRQRRTKVALTFVLFHQRLCGPLANSLFHHQPDSDARPNSKLEAAYHKADESIRNVIQLLEAA